MSATATYASRVFQAQWSSFQLPKKAFEACVCEGDDGFCACFMNHEEGRALFANHCSVRKYLGARTQNFYDKQESIQFWTSYRQVGTVPGCTCPTEDCHCILDPSDPLEVERREMHNRQIANLTERWHAELSDYGLSTITKNDTFVLKASDDNHDDEDPEQLLQKKKRQKLLQLADAFAQERDNCTHTSTLYSPMDSPGRSYSYTTPTYSPWADANDEPQPKKEAAVEPVSP